MDQLLYRIQEAKRIHQQTGEILYIAPRGSNPFRNPNNGQYITKSQYYISDIKRKSR